MSTTPTASGQNDVTASAQADQHDVTRAIAPEDGQAEIEQTEIASPAEEELPDLVVVGAGLFGLTIAQQAAEHGHTVRVIDVRDHIGGNAYSYFDKETGIEIHRYGAHLFHTSDERVWAYANRFTRFTGYVHKVYATHDGEVYPLPVNLGTINQFFHAHYSPAQAARLIKEQSAQGAGGQGAEPANLEEQGIRLIGRPLFEAFIKNYTAKQWQTDTKDLPASIIRRLPVRLNYDNRYFSDTHEGLPVDGYTAWMARMIDDPKICLTLGADFFDTAQPWNKQALVGRVPVVYTGPVDRYFGYSLGQLTWRTVDFTEHRYHEKDHFGTPVMNFVDADVPYTRSIEFKNFNPERTQVMQEPETIVWDEYSRFAGKDDEPYYPVNTPDDRRLFARYKDLEKDEPRVVFGGRLGAYAYFNMDQTLGAALDAFDQKVLPLL